MKRILTITIILSLLFTTSHIANAQKFEKVNTRITNIHRENGLSFDGQDSNFRISLKSSWSCISGDGTVLFNYRKMYKSFRSSDKPVIVQGLDSNIEFKFQMLNHQGNQFVYTTEEFINNTWEYTLYFLDVLKNQIVAEYDPIEYGIFPFDISKDFSTFAYCSGPSIVVVDKTSDTYDITNKVPVGEKYLVNLFLSKSGNRLIYQPSETSGYVRSFVYYTDRISNSYWTEKKEIPVPTYPFGPTYALNILDIANDGHTLLFRGESGFGIMEYQNEQWGEPRIIISYNNNTWNMETTSISDDGVHILAQQYVEDSDYFGAHLHNLLLYSKDSSGKWQEQQVNPNGVYCVGDALMSRDGSTIVWTPSKRISGHPAWDAMR
ncbi:hypothetical protein GF373_13560 [bacterium]|nr:hypothetical protein [bacterium]